VNRFIIAISLSTVNHLWQFLSDIAYIKINLQLYCFAKIPTLVMFSAVHCYKNIAFQLGNIFVSFGSDFLHFERTMPDVYYLFIAT